MLNRDGNLSLIGQSNTADDSPACLQEVSLANPLPRAANGLAYCWWDVDRVRRSKRRLEPRFVIVYFTHYHFGRVHQALRVTPPPKAGSRSTSVD
jgi:hypothetical protein